MFRDKVPTTHLTLCYCFERSYILRNQQLFRKNIVLSLLTMSMKCLHEPVGMTLRTGFDLRAVVWRSLNLIYSIFVLPFYPKFGTSVPFFHDTASHKTSQIKL